MAKHATGTGSTDRSLSKSRFEFHDRGVKRESWLSDIEEKKSQMWS